MPLINFQEQFAPVIVAGLRGEPGKTQTIRALRKDPIQVGDVLFLYTGARTPKVRHLGNAVCKETTLIKIEPMQVLFEKDGSWMPMNEPEALAAFAKADGFLSWTEMGLWFKATHGLPFSGQLIQWQAQPKHLRNSEYGKLEIGPSNVIKKPKVPADWDYWIENGVWYAAPKLSRNLYGQHAYYTNGEFNHEHDCPCGCYMMSASSGGPVNPFGPCPKNPRKGAR